MLNYLLEIFIRKVCIIIKMNLLNIRIIQTIPDTMYVIELLPKIVLSFLFESYQLKFYLITCNLSERGLRMFVNPLKKNDIFYEYVFWKLSKYTKWIYFTCRSSKSW